jgi:hypothetical protein
VTRAATPEAATAATLGVYGKTLTQEALGIHNIYEMRTMAKRRSRIAAKRAGVA